MFIELLKADSHSVEGVWNLFYVMYKVPYAYSFDLVIRERKYLIPILDQRLEVD